MVMVSLVGEGITAGEGIAARLQNALRSSDVRLLAQGSSRLSISVAVSEVGRAEAVESLHSEFFHAASPEIFAVTPESERALAPVTTTRGRMAAGFTLADARG